MDFRRKGIYQVSNSVGAGDRLGCKSSNADGTLRHGGEVRGGAGILCSYCILGIVFPPSLVFAVGLSCERLLIFSF